MTVTEYALHGEKNVPNGVSVENFPLPQATITDPQEYLRFLSSFTGHQNFAINTYRARQFINSSTNLYFPTNGSGLGDSLRCLPYIAQVARYHPHAQIHAFVSPETAEMFSNLPSVYPNLNFETSVPYRQINAPTSTTIILGSFQSSFMYSQVGRWITDLPDIDLLDTLKSKGKIIDKDIACVDASQHRHKIRSYLFPDLPFMTHHADNLLSLLALGVPISEPVYYQPFFYPPSPNPDLETDLLIVPDSRERKGIKSLSLSGWNKIMPLLENFSSPGVVIGTSNPQYTQEVYLLAASIFPNTRRIQGNLNTIATAAVSTQVMVGMDSGTTHLAELFHIASGFNNPHIKELYHTTYTNPLEYALNTGPVLLFEPDPKNQITPHQADAISHYINN